MVVTKEMMKEANKYWEMARERVLKVAAEMGADVENRKNFDGFVDDLFNGDNEPTDNELREAITDFLTY